MYRNDAIPLNPGTGARDKRCVDPMVHFWDVPLASFDLARAWAVYEDVKYTINTRLFLFLVVC